MPVVRLIKVELLLHTDAVDRVATADLTDEELRSFTITTLLAVLKSGRSHPLFSKPIIESVEIVRGGK